MVDFTHLFIIFGLRIDNFLFAAVILILTILVIGIVLMARNIRPIIGFLLLILALAMVIGIAYDMKSIKRELKEVYEKILK